MMITSENRLIGANQNDLQVVVSRGPIGEQVESRTHANAIDSFVGVYKVESLSAAIEVRMFRR